MSLDGGGFVSAPVTPPFGSETRQILGGLGFSAAEIETFLAEELTREGMKPRG